MQENVKDHSFLVMTIVSHASFDEVFYISTLISSDQNISIVFLSISSTML